MWGVRGCGARAGSPVTVLTMGPLVETQPGVCMCVCVAGAGLPAIMAESSSRGWQGRSFPTAFTQVCSCPPPPPLCMLLRTMATAEARGCCSAISSLRSCLTSSPVLILTGHFSWHMPSAHRAAGRRVGGQRSNAGCVGQTPPAARLVLPHACASPPTSPWHLHETELPERKAAAPSPSAWVPGHGSCGHEPALRSAGSC